MAYDYEPHQKPKMSKEESDRLMKEFLEKGVLNMRKLQGHGLFVSY